MKAQQTLVQATRVRKGGVAALAVTIISLTFAQTCESSSMAPVSVRDVEVEGEIGRRINITIERNLLALDVERDFLRPFREKKAAGGYIGLGKLIDATVRFTAHTNDDEVIAFKNRLVRETIKTQLSDGYIGVFVPDRRIATYWDLHEMVYIIQGLLSDYKYFDNRLSLDAARRLGDYIVKRRPGNAPPRSVGKLNTERAFIALSEATGEKRYLDYCVDGMDLRNWRSPVQGHAYTFMNLCIAQLDLYNIGPDDDLLGQSRRVVDFLTKDDGLVIAGTCSQKEGWHTNQDGRGNLGETCATAYLIRLLHNMLQIEGKAFYGDIMERAIYNALFAAQSPDGRRLRYFTPFEGRRLYYPRDTYCCPNNFRRITAELPGMVYYHADDGLAINLYTYSTAVVTLGNNVSLKVRTETDYPSSGKVVVYIDPSRPTNFALQLRIPRWCKKAKITVNKEEVKEAVNIGGFSSIDRQWKAGDRVELEMPMEWRLVRGRKIQKGRAAVMRGPLLFCLNPARQEAVYPIFGGQRGQRAVELADLNEQLCKAIVSLGSMEGAPVNLADIVGGGAGFGSGKLGSGVDPRNGGNTTGGAGYLQGEANVFAPAESEFVDGVVIPDGGKDGKTPVKITSTGITVTGIADTCTQTWDFFRHGPGNSQKFFNVGDVDFRSGSRSMLAIHANKLITFDLDAIRKSTGYKALRFCTSVGYGGAADPTVDFSVYVDGEPLVNSTPIRRAGVFLDLPIGSDRRFLTLVVTDANKNISHDQIFFGDPLLLPEPSIGTEKDDKIAEQRGRLIAEIGDLKRRISMYPTVGALLKGIRLEMNPPEGPVGDATVRPEGLACHVQARSPGCVADSPPDLNLVLTEFADPGGEAVFFSVLNTGMDELVDDELTAQ
ncbi:MAG: glycoside hydrolase family 127 protein [Phycisphaerales bacterium]|nr:MAG: glycoside hydrolase family 127 protein [Phycisphaerales bacterium]